MKLTSTLASPLATLICTRLQLQPAAQSGAAAAMALTFTVRVKPAAAMPLHSVEPAATGTAA